MQLVVRKGRNMIRAVIFDMDGTLVDSETVSTKAWHKTAATMGIDVPDSLIRALIGLNAVLGKQVIAEHFNGDTDLAERAFNMHMDIFLEIASTELELMPSARECLQKLQAAGYPLALATSTHRIRAVPRLERFGLESMFATLTCGNEVERSKPEPDIFLAAAKSLGVESARCAVVEDSFNGVRAGHAAGMHTFMIPDQVEPTAEIAALCTAVLPSLAELPAAIAEL